MRSTVGIEPSQVNCALDALDAAVERIGELSFEACSAALRLHVLERLETARRRQSVLSHDLIAGLANDDPVEMGRPNAPTA